MSDTMKAQEADVWSKWERNLRDVGGWDNELHPIPAGPVKAMILEGHRLREQLSAAEQDARRMREAMQLVWSIHVRKHVHLGYERASGVEQHCIPCIAACALGKAFDSDCVEAADFAREIENVKATDAALPVDEVMK